MKPAMKQGEELDRVELNLEKMKKNFKLRIGNKDKDKRNDRSLLRKIENSPPRFRNYDEFKSITYRVRINEIIADKGLSSSTVLKKPLNDLPKLSKSIITSFISNPRTKVILVPNSSFPRLKNVEQPNKPPPLPLPPLPHIRRPFFKRLKKNSNVRKLKAALTHYRLLQLETQPFYKLFEFFPGRAYGHLHCQDFIKHCKNGEKGKVLELLALNPWLAHGFDHSRVSAIHWAVIRGQLEIMDILLRFKVWLNVGDFVFDI